MRQARPLAGVADDGSGTVNGDHAVGGGWLLGLTNPLQQIPHRGKQGHDPRLKVLGSQFSAGDSKASAVPINISPGKARRLVQAHSAISQQFDQVSPRSEPADPPHGWSAQGVETALAWG